MSGGGKGPVSLEDLLKRKRNLQESQSRPVFMSRKKREELRALERSQEENKKNSQAEATRARSGANPSSRAKANEVMPMDLEDGEIGRDDRRPLKRGRDERTRRDRDRGRDDRGDRHHHSYRRERRGADQGGRGRGEREHEASGSGARGGKIVPKLSEKERELEAIKRQYLGEEKQKRKARKASDRYKFKFDWDATEDTSADPNALYQRPVEASLLFGRGRRGGDELARVGKGSGLGDDRRWSDKSLEEMTERDWRIFREDHSISFKGSRIPRPFRSWDDAARSMPESILRGVRDAGYKKPSPIQMAAMPIGLQQRDVIGVAETGSGKTCAFVLPMLSYISKQPPMTTEEVAANGPYAIVLAPTRELAQQIEEETTKFAKHMGYRVVCVVGGQSISEQGAQLRRGCEIVIATPGRLLDCLQSSYAVLNQCNYVVLDEADRMIDMGFEPQVQGILDAMPSTNLKPEDESVELEADRVYRTTYMFSATMPPAVERLAKKYLRSAVVVTIGRAGKAGANVTQTIRLIKENEKPSKLKQELYEINDDTKQCIVFVNTKSQCNSVAKQVEKLGHYCVVLHGGKAQDQREAAIKEFKAKRCSVLVATDVAGRGIDVDNVTKVVNYDMPNNIESYTHRIGRTGRAGKKGHAVSLLTMADERIFYDLVQLLKEAGQKVPSDLMKQEAARKRPMPGPR